MSRSMWITVLWGAVTIAPVAMAQQPAPMSRDSVHRGMGRMGAMGAMGPRRGPGMHEMAGGVASMLLVQTAELKLSDQQVTRLAALARSAESQRTAMRATMDSMHRTMMANHGAPNAPPAMSAEMEARMKAAHDQMHANIRDALAVLTPDQLATAWEHVHAMHGPGMMGGMREGAGPMPKPE